MEVISDLDKNSCSGAASRENSGNEIEKKKTFLELLILREKKNFFRGFAIKREKEMRQ